MVIEGTAIPVRLEIGPGDLPGTCARNRLLIEEAT
jgi:hypothetical protein